MGSRLYRQSGLATFCLSFAISVFAPHFVAAQNIPVADVPSGRATVLFQELGQLKQEPPSWRFRFVQEDLLESFEYEDVASDLLHLCATIALPELGENVAKVGQIIVSVANKETEFGVADPELAQAFEVFDVVDGHCQWGDL